MPIVELDPNMRDNIPKTLQPIHHVRMAQVINLCYGVIEELGLEVRASSKKPSCLTDGSWNPEVKSDLEARLTKAKVDLEEQFLWNVRGPRTSLEMLKPRQVHLDAVLAPWCRWHVRDQFVSVVDAIAHLSWIRSHVCSHRLNTTRVGLLSAYDVANAQMISRRLIFESLGLWRRIKPMTDDEVASK